MLPPTGSSEWPSPAPTPPAVTKSASRATRTTFGTEGSAAGGSSAVSGSGGGKEAAQYVKTATVPRLGKLEDRKLWALLAREAVQLGECRAAAEYLVAAQRHNDAFHDRENVTR